MNESTSMNYYLNPCSGSFSGLGLNFKMNGSPIVVPMASQEPNMIAAVSGAAKTITQSGGFKTSYTLGDILVAQIQILDLGDVDTAAEVIIQHKSQLIEFAQLFCPLVQWNRLEVVDITVGIVPLDTNQDIISVESKHYNQDEFDKNIIQKDDKIVIVDVHINISSETIHHNTLNTILQPLASKLIELVGGRLGQREIVTNFSAVDRRSKAQFRIPFSKLEYKNMKGEDIATKILEGYILACEDPYRAVSHNKGIMNGVDAVAAALGQDFRAIESGAHAWACRNGKYQPLSSYRIIEGDEDWELEGNLEIPTPLSLVGPSHPATVGEVLAMVGLAQNFAALRTMVSEGINWGQLSSLHSKNIAVQAGAPAVLVPQVAAYMHQIGKISLASAQAYLKSYAIMCNGRKPFLENSGKKILPSTLLVELNQMEIEPFSVNIVFESIGENSYHLAIKTPGDRKGLFRAGNTDMVDVLFGRRDAKWFQEVFGILGKLKLAKYFKDPRRSNLSWQYKAKVLSILMNLLLLKLIEEDPVTTKQLLKNLICAHLNPLDFIKDIRSVKEVFRVGASLLTSIFFSLKNHIDEVPCIPLSNGLKEEQLRVISNAIILMDETDPGDLEQFMSDHCRRSHVTFFLLCELISLNTSLITPECLRFVYLLGSHLDTEAHWEKSDMEYKAYQFWLKLNRKNHTTQSTQQFLNETKILFQEKKKKLEEMSSFAPFTELGVLLHSDTHSAVHQYYILMRYINPNAKL